MLNNYERQTIVPIFDQVLTTILQYNTLIQGFELYITGSSLNLVERSYKDIDLMVVIPLSELKNSKLTILTTLWEGFRDNNQKLIQELQNDKRVKMFGLSELYMSLSDSMKYAQEITNSDQEALINRLGSTNEVTRLLMDPERELTAIKVRLEGMLEAEKQVAPIEGDGSQGYQFGSLVEVFLKGVTSGLCKPAQDGQPMFQIEWCKSFSEGYGRIAGENNCYIYSRFQSAPVHLFLTTGVDHKKAMEKKESFMLEYYSEGERLRPIKLI